MMEAKEQSDEARWVELIAEYMANGENTTDSEQRQVGKAYLDLLKQQEEQNQRYREALEKYGQHTKDCASLTFRTISCTDVTDFYPECDCGFDEARNALEGE